jgi:hypothetical protein
MAFKHFPQYTLLGGAERLSVILQAVAGVDQSTPTSPGSAKQVGGADDAGFRHLFLQPDGGNGNPIYLGGDATVSATNHAFRMEKGNAGVPPGPTQVGPFDASGLKASDVWIFGTAGDKLHVGGVPA